MLNPADFGLIKNPFSLVPGVGVRRWAGMPQTKKALTDVVASVRPNDIGSSEFVVIHGKYGAGKTHALEYFAHCINTPHPEEEHPGRAIYIGEVVEGSGLSFSALYARILEKLKEDKVIARVARGVKESVQATVTKMSDQMGYEITDDALAIHQAVSLPHDRAMIESLNKYGIPFQADKGDLAAADALSSLFRVMTSPIGDHPPCYGAVYLFLDEMEALGDIKTPQQHAFFNALRALINKVPEHFCLIFSFTLDAAVLERVLPGFLLERKTRAYIECENFLPASAKEFVREYLREIRPEGYTSFSPPLPPQDFHPFTEEAIDFIFEHDNTALVPRRILKNMLRVWERASRRELLQPGGEITREMADEILTGIGV